MSAILIIGESGTGKTTSLRNLDPKKTLLIQTLDKELPFKNKFLPFDKTKKVGSRIVTADPRLIATTLLSPSLATIGKEIVVIDDFQYIMAFEFMNRAKETGFNKFTEIAKNAFDVIMAAKDSSARVYFLAHSEKEEDGFVKAKTIGKLLNDKITVEGLFTIVLRTIVEEGEENKFFFSTKRENDVVKAPIGMFKEDLIDNDLAVVDSIITNYYK